MNTTTKMQMLQEFLLWCVGGTELGTAFAAGPGANIVRELTALAKRLEPQVGKQRNQEVEDLRSQVAQLTELVKHQSQQLQSGGGGSSSAIGPEAVAEIQKLRSELHSLKNELGVENKDERPTT